MRFPLCISCLFFVALLANAGELEKNPKLLKLETNRWVKLHQQKKGEGVVFMRQAHGGSCFDSKRGKLVLFGSNTHGRDWKNSPFIFDPVKNSWERVYKDDLRPTYKVTDKGIPVAGEKGDHPWATHTFGCVLYDASRDEMVICCPPSHMRPGKFTNTVKDLWPQIKIHPTWVFNMATRTWKPLPCKAVGFFPNCAGYDSDRKLIIGHRSSGVYELAGEPRTWKRIKNKGFFGWHDNCAYDSKHKALIVFGTNRNSNEIVVYDPAKGEYKKMPTAGTRPPKDQHNPMAFYPKLEQTVILVDRTKKKDQAEKDTTETWCYDLGKDAWTQIKSATLPFPCGMNYNMEYDSVHDVLLLVTGGYRGATTVWALKPELKAP